SQRVLFFKLSNIFLYTVGGVIGMDIVGIDLTTLTMFSGALGLGIGFGLQKVFSNLMSGIILLLDKSIKPGDVISVGDTFGWVNALGARHVSVLTRDGKEHLIPNENLITQTVENWSYTDKKIRIRIPVGVSYASDMALVRKLLLQAVTEHHRILKDPAPACYMTGFGESSVNHLLLVWINDPTDGVANITSDIYYRIWDLFKEHKIELPFPQRDVHLKIDKDSPVVPTLR
ncbi:MAG: mechanosensitive ion channel, partial [Alphaproteobacteria bacterium]|nr:mechanosensitive ion channel [Alphaproteobacteria bacterium]